MMTVSNMLTGALQEPNGKLGESRKEKGWRYEYRANVNHAVGVLKDRLVGILIADDTLVRNHLYRKLVGEIRRRIVPV
jgi:hypothetical protein